MIVQWSSQYLDDNYMAMKLKSMHEEMYYGFLSLEDWTIAQFPDRLDNNVIEKYMTSQ